MMLNAKKISTFLSVQYMGSLYISTHTVTHTKPRHTPFVGVFDEQAGQQGLGVGRQSAWELDVLHEDELKQLLMVLVVERQSSTHHLIRNHTQTPPVHRPTVVVVLQDLRRVERKKYTITFFRWDYLFYWTSASILHFCIYFIGQYRLPKVFVKRQMSEERQQRKVNVPFCSREK